MDYPSKIVMLREIPVQGCKEFWIPYTYTDILVACYWLQCHLITHWQYSVTCG